MGERAKCSRWQYILLLESLLAWPSVESDLDGRRGHRPSHSPQLVLGGAPTRREGPSAFLPPQWRRPKSHVRAHAQTCPLNLRKRNQEGRGGEAAVC
eukprot:1747106-Pleurochrysis_carterae.AAC.1